MGQLVGGIIPKNMSPKPLSPKGRFFAFPILHYSYTPIFHDASKTDCTPPEQNQRRVIWAMMFSLGLLLLFPRFFVDRLILDGHVIAAHQTGDELLIELLPPVTLPILPDLGLDFRDARRF